MAQTGGFLYGFTFGTIGVVIIIITIVFIIFIAYFKTKGNRRGRLTPSKESSQVIDTDINIAYDVVYKYRK